MRSRTHCFPIKARLDIQVLHIQVISGGDNITADKRLGDGRRRRQYPGHYLKSVGIILINHVVFSKLFKETKCATMNIFRKKFFSF